ncbi:hypothetical protein [Actomonas aquatica]|uniref:Uncharacterized protein n=1 Tax=Actomonas aquatica TaxID=2866162 RepID=A0ABZ1CBJ1_9BACT|nr:hypothetical protein [Opitutus sp. WL0086]WRQ88687.1 hypothetical protein K1X11_004675 [Opitutus sp. WL0086]
MTTFAEHRAAPNEDAELEARTGLRGVPTWRGVYLLVLVTFAVLVGAMTLFSLHYA